MITIRVFRNSGQTPVSGKEVSLHDSVGYRRAKTDASGSVNFDVKSGRYTVHIDGRIYHDGPIVGVLMLYV